MLDVACGIGEPAIPAAQRVGLAGKVFATGLVAGVVAFAKEEAQALKLTDIEFVVSHGGQLNLPSTAFDAATLRWGSKYMPEPAACLQRIHGDVVPGASFATATWAAPDKNPWASMPPAVVKRYTELPSPGQTRIRAFASPERQKNSMIDAGYRGGRFAGVALRQSARKQEARLRRRCRRRSRAAASAQARRRVGWFHLDCMGE